MARKMLTITPNDRRTRSRGVSSVPSKLSPVLRHSDPGNVTAISRQMKTVRRRVAATRKLDAGLGADNSSAPKTAKNVEIIYI